MIAYIPKYMKNMRRCLNEITILYAKFLTVESEQFFLNKNKNQNKKSH